jgi:dienelactone hydrolase
LLAARLNAVVLVPDCFKGDALEAHIIPADTDEKKKRIGSLLATSANVERNLGVLLAAVPECRVRFPSVNKWGANGLCWGGKVSLAAKLATVV